LEVPEIALLVISAWKFNSRILSIPIIGWIPPLTLPDRTQWPWANVKERRFYMSEKKLTTKNSAPVVDNQNDILAGKNFLQRKEKIS
jgi:hypothetical protein